MDEIKCRKNKNIPTITPKTYPITSTHVMGATIVLCSLALHIILVKDNSTKMSRPSQFHGYDRNHIHAMITKRAKGNPNEGRITRLKSQGFTGVSTSYSLFINSSAQSGVFFHLGNQNQLVPRPNVPIASIPQLSKIAP